MRSRRHSDRQGASGQSNEVDIQRRKHESGQVPEVAIGTA